MDSMLVVGVTKEEAESSSAKRFISGVNNYE